MIALMLPKRKIAPRLPSFDYRGTYSYFITCSTFKRADCFRTGYTVDMVRPVLRDSSIEEGFSVYTYCFMPDHLHLLVCGEERSILPKYVKKFKQLSGHLFKEKTGNQLWQRGYYEHVIRAEETLEDVARYILNNPVRSELVDDFHKYPYCGSFIFDINLL